MRPARTIIFPTLSALAALLLLPVSAIRSLAAQDPIAVQDPGPTDKVNSLNELRARTDAERRRAIFFDSYGAGPGSIPQLAVDGGTLVAYACPPSPGLDELDVEAILLDEADLPEETKATLRLELEKRQLAQLPLRQERQRAASVCTRTHIFVGHVKSAKTLMNREESWLFTDYTVAVDRWVVHRRSETRIPTATVEELLWSDGSADVQVGGKRISTLYGDWRSPVGHQSVFLLAWNEEAGTLLGWELEIKGRKVADEFTGSDLDLEEFVGRTLRALSRCAEAR